MKSFHIKSMSGQYVRGRVVGDQLVVETSDMALVTSETARCLIDRIAARMCDSSRLKELLDRTSPEKVVSAIDAAETEMSAESDKLLGPQELVTDEVSGDA